MRVGLDIGGTKTDAVVLDEAGAIAHSLRMPTGWGPDAVLETAKTAVDELATATETTPAAFDSIGIGIPGMVDAEHGVVSHALNLGVERLALGELLADCFGTTVRIENDVNAAALGAFHQQKLAVDSSMAYLNLGTGLAAGLVLRGQLWRGSHGTAGEIGHVLVDPAGPVDMNGEHGGLEVVASGSGIARQWGRETETPVHDMLAAAASGDQRAQAIRSGLYEGVASAVRMLVLTVDVDVVVIGGGISNLGDELFDEVRSVIARWESRSSFITSLTLAERIRVLPRGAQTAATGAAWLGGIPWQK